MNIQPKKKRRKISSNFQKPRFDLKGHKDTVNCVEWYDDYNLVSGSSDHSLRVWDVESGIAINVMTGNESVSCLETSNDHKSILTGHPDRVLRMWDPRIDASKLITRKLRSHSNWITSVHWHPENPNLFISSSYDSTVKVWDLRSDYALFTLETGREKALCSAWNGPRSILSGGSSRRVSVFSFNE
jgi:ribosome biogenesis protein YTM1